MARSTSNPDSKPNLGPAKMLGAAMAFIGGSVLLSWYLSSLELVTEPALWVVMQWSTALGFVLTGLAVVAHCARRRRTALMLGGGAAGLGSIALAEQLLTAGGSSVVLFKGGMAAGTALSFALAGGMILVFSIPRTRRSWRDATTVVMASALAAAGFVGLLGRILDADRPTSWSALSGMEIHTALAFMGLGIAFFTMLGHFRDGLMDQRIPRWASWAAGLGVGVLIVGIWHGLTSSEQRLRDSAIARTHEATLVHANKMLQDHQRDVLRLGTLWSRSSASERVRMNAEEEVFVEDFPALRRLVWFAADGSEHPLWSAADVSPDGIVSQLGGNAALERSRRTGRLAISEPSVTDSGQKSLFVSLPVRRDELALGELLLEHDLSEFFGEIFGRSNTAAFAVELATEGGHVFYRSHPTESSPLAANSASKDHAGAEQQIAFGDRIWTIRGASDGRWLAGRRSTANTLLLWVGLFLAVAIAFVVRKSELLRDKAASLEVANGEVETNSEALALANRSLEQQRDSLRRTEDQLRRAAREKRRVLDSLSAFLIGVDHEGIVTEWNYVSSELLGLRSSETLGRRFEDLDLNWDRESVRDAVRECLASGRRVARDNYAIGMPTGSEDRVVSFTVNPTLDQVRRGFAIIGSDVTERQLLEMQLHHAQKLESVGTLAAGIAHEINTPMQFVGDNVRFLSQSVGPITDTLKKVRDMLADAPATPADASAGSDAATSGEPSDAVPAPSIDMAAMRNEVKLAVEDLDVDFMAEEFPMALEETLEGIERVTTIVRAMKDFSHPGTEGCASANLNQAIETTLAVARNEYKYHAKVETDFGDLPQVQCWVADLNQVFLNLLVNATHAIRDKLGEHSTEQGTITISTRRDGDSVEVRVADTGGGIPESAQQKIFDQFFTTKSVGRGTGLGLAIARAVVVDRHGGTLDFETEEGVGTTFIVRIPIERDLTEADDEAHPVC
ncbi:MAG: hypothetical protein DHS20C15_18540 [Planctomycetota bacterium]|nr:MAG: hypothetical protein DHS20C15_18540 [Planctomycetota bacterium]